VATGGHRVGAGYGGGWVSGRDQLLRQAGIMKGPTTEAGRCRGGADIPDLVGRWASLRGRHSNGWL
jgi:hypothetical protein